MKCILCNVDSEQAVCYSCGLTLIEKDNVVYHYDRKLAVVIPKKLVSLVDPFNKRNGKDTDVNVSKKEFHRISDCIAYFTKILDLGGV